MTTPYLVPCLVELRTAINGRFPQRDKTSDGWIGDLAHQATTSKHNPDSAGRVHAIDVDKDLRDGTVTMQDVIDRILHNQRNGDRRLQNIIFNRRIWSRSWGWTPREYDGLNAHQHHAHFEARTVDTARNATYSWPMPPHPIPEDDMPTPEEVAAAVWEARPWRATDPATVAIAMQRVYDRSDDVAALADRLSAIELTMAEIRAAVIPPPA